MALPVTPSPAPAPEPPPVSVPQVSANKGGRPPKAFWEDLWIEMACQIWAGELDPDDKQVKIEDAMGEGDCILDKPTHIAHTVRVNGLAVRTPSAMLVPLASALGLQPMMPTETLKYEWAASSAVLFIFAPVSGLQFPSAEEYVARPMRA